MNGSPPTNCDDLLFDDVLWVQNARRDHFDFIDKMRERDVEVVELHDLLAETMEIPEARSWLLDRKIVANEVGLGLVDDTRGGSSIHCSRVGSPNSSSAAWPPAIYPPRCGPATARWPAKTAASPST